eukprot:XP_015580679.1 G-type lectin S-receptor-like serine/threonine-protein kinase At4g27290 [Ricinus communis]
MGGFVVLLLYSFLISIITTSTSLDRINLEQFIRDGETIASTGGRFELGFFSPENSKMRFVGVWYKNISPQTVVWVANRSSPLSNTMGALNLTSQGILLLTNSTNNFVWSSNVSRTAKDPVAQLLETGNLVVRDKNDTNPDNYLWQSFDYPCDTLLPGMKLGRNLITGPNRFMSSWKSAEDPDQGKFSLILSHHGYPQLILFEGSEITYRPGSWNGETFTGAGRKANPIFIHRFINNEIEVYYAYEPANAPLVSRFMLNPSGIAQLFKWEDETNKWKVVSTPELDECENYALCGPNANCRTNGYPACACLNGFVPESPTNWKSQEWSDGCIRRTPLVCNDTDRFVKYTGIKLPDTSSSWYDRSIDIKECEVLCLKNCSCTAYANLDIRGGGSGCLLWFNNLMDIRILDGGQDLYVRVAASEIDELRKQRRFGRKQVGLMTGCATFITFILIIFYLWRRNIRKQEMVKKRGGENHKYDDRNEDMGLLTFNLKTISEATNNFSSSNKLGQGGFGPVYKGTLKDGKEVAVKRLSKSSGQGLNEFKNEVILIARLQHRNLVKLLGCCTHEDEKMLIYEYMPNKSLDFFIFDKMRSKLLDWHKRFHIIGGIARGLLYLHQDSRLKIIHRDLKASNILLDNEMNPKISDFGLARIFGADQTEANTNRIVGTYGYMSPEYAMNGHFSIKSDVFSFGVLVLEIISGKKNRDFCHEDHNINLIGHAWKLWIEGTPLELIDECLTDIIDLSQVLRSIHVALLCVQKKPEDRPNMSSAVLMLGSENPLPRPKQPGFFMESPPPEANTTRNNHTSFSANEVTFTILEAR